MRIARFVGGPLDGDIRVIPDRAPVEFPIDVAADERTAKPGEALPPLVEGKRLGAYLKDPAHPRRWIWHPEVSL